MNAQGTAEDLVKARELLLAGGRRPVELRDALGELCEFWIAGQARRVGVEGHGIAVLAVGALGRNEFLPYSDLDLVLLHDGSTRSSSQIARLAEQLWYPLWNSGVALDHSVRTTAEALSVAERDLRVIMGLLEARHLAGDEQLSATLIEAVRQRWRAGIRRRFDDLAQITLQRWERSGEIAQRAEPDLKSGRGGQRDVRLLQALAMAQVIDRPGDEILAANALLADVRTRLHLIAGRARDVLRAQDGDEVAAELGVSGKFELARMLSAAGRTIGYAVGTAFRIARSARRWSKPSRRPLDEGVVLHGDEVALARDADPKRDPVLLLRVAAAAAQIGKPIAVGTLARLAEHSAELRCRWPDRALDELLALLGAGPGLVDVIESLERTGLWGRMFPEWGAVRDLPPRDPTHRWTVDRHLVHTCVAAASLVTRVSRPDLLLLGALLHDIGKGRDQDHSVLGAAVSAQVGRRLGLQADDVATLSAMVRHHLLLSHTATRRDVQDPVTVERVVRDLNGDPVLLELLQALTEADSRATGSGVWTAWKAELIAELVYRCTAVMTGSVPLEPEPLGSDQRELAAQVAYQGKPDVLLTEEGGTATLTMVAPAAPGLLSRAAGVLALNSLEVHAASAGEHAEVAVAVFTVSPRFGSLPQTTLLREQFAMALDGRLVLAERIAAKERDYARTATEFAPPKVIWFTEEASDAVVLELRAADRIGLLYRVASAIENCGPSLRWARAATLGAVIVDSFCLTGVVDDQAKKVVEGAVLAAVSATPVP